MGPQSLEKWPNHPTAEDEYQIKVSEFLMTAGIETVVLGLGDGDNNTILYFTMRQNLTTARNQREYTPGTMDFFRCFPAGHRPPATGHRTTEHRTAQSS